MKHFKKLALTIFLISAYTFIQAQNDSLHTISPPDIAPVDQDHGVMINDAHPAIQDSSSMEGVPPSSGMDNRMQQPTKDKTQPTEKMNTTVPSKDVKAADDKSKKAVTPNTVKEQQVKDAKASPIKPVAKPVRKKATAKTTADKKTMYLLKDSTVRHDPLLNNKK